MWGVWSWASTPWAGSATQNQGQSQTAADEGQLSDIAGVIVSGGLVDAAVLIESVAVAVSLASADVRSSFDDALSIHAFSAVFDPALATDIVVAQAAVGPVFETFDVAVAPQVQFAATIADAASGIDVIDVRALLLSTDSMRVLDGFVSVDGRTRIDDVRMQAHPMRTASFDVATRQVVIELTNGAPVVDVAHAERSVLFGASKRAIVLTLI